MHEKLGTRKEFFFFFYKNRRFSCFLAEVIGELELASFGRTIKTPCLGRGDVRFGQFLTRQTKCLCDSFVHGFYLLPENFINSCDCNRDTTNAQQEFILVVCCIQVEGYLPDFLACDLFLNLFGGVSCEAKHVCR